MQLAVDNREIAVLDKLNQLNAAELAAAKPPELSLTVEQLPIGDFILRKDGRDIIIFERKSLQDLLASIKDGRYEEQSHRLIHTTNVHPHNVVYVIEGIMSTVHNKADKTILSSAMTSLSYFKGFSILRTISVIDTAEQIWAMATKIAREFKKGKPIPVYAAFGGGGEDAPASIAATESGEPIAMHPTPAPTYSSFVQKQKHANITPANIGEILLCQIPGISSTTAVEIMRQFNGSFSRFMDAVNTQPELIQTMYLGGQEGKRRKLGSNIIRNILLYLRDTDTTESECVDNNIQ